MIVNLPTKKSHKVYQFIVKVVKLFSIYKVITMTNCDTIKTVYSDCSDKTICQRQNLLHPATDPDFVDCFQINFAFHIQNWNIAKRQTIKLCILHNYDVTRAQSLWGTPTFFFLQTVLCTSPTDSFFVFSFDLFGTLG
jgi:hypothetical protein